jgi:hypothetical protein
MKPFKLTYSEFNALPLDNKIHLLETEGVIIAIKEFSSTLIELYAIYDFYAELKYNTIHGVIVGLNILNLREQLEAYLNNIDIKDVYY